MRFYDTHAHLNDEAFAEDIPGAIQRAVENGVDRMNIVGCDLPSSRKAVELSQEYDCLYAVVGIHPSDADKWDKAAEEVIRDLARCKKTVAIGEIGLDYHFEDDVDHGIQRDVFEQQVLLSLELGLPMVIHSRDAFEDTVSILKKHLPENGYKGVFHCFSGSWEQAKICLAMGFYLGLDGPVTFKNAKKPVQVCQNIPLDRLLIETDCPYMAPEPVRGKRNEPANVVYIAEKICALRGIDTKTGSEILYNNGLALFGC